MVKVKEDMTGWVMAEHGVPDSRLTVIRQTEDYVKPNGRREAQWLCECGCKEHNLITVVGWRLKDNSRPTLSCGCVNKEKLHETNKKYNKYDLTGEYGIGWTSNTNRKFYFDLEDYDKIKDYCWMEQFHTDGYCSLESRDPISKKRIKMHILLYHRWCDHKDRNPFNNRKSNLRAATVQENNMNRSLDQRNKSGFTGVRWSERLKKWISEIRINKRTKYLGLFINKEEAIIVRLKAESEYFGEFAPQRHLFEQYGITQQNDLNEIRDITELSDDDNEI